jgi:hypothetical protein
MKIPSCLFTPNAILIGAISLFLGDDFFVTDNRQFVFFKN